MRIFLPILFFVGCQICDAQEAMRVERCTAVSPDAPVYNVFVDEEDRKWVCNSEGLFQVHAADLATPVVLVPGEESILQYPDGNVDFRLPQGELNQLLGGRLSSDNQITSAYYNAVQDHLWVGTDNSGIYLFRTQPKLKWVPTINKRLPKFRSNHVNSIYVDGETDRHFFATDEGIIVGQNGRWGLEEKYFRFQAITHRGKEIWLLAEDLIWIVGVDDRWRSVSIDPEQIEGAIKDIAFDKDGRLWIASELLTVYDVDRETYRVFDGADYFTSSDVNCIDVDRTGAVWVGTQDKGLYVIEKATAMTVTCLVEKEVSCVEGVNDGALVVKIKGGQPPYTYQWDQGLTGENPTGLGPGTYTVTVTDENGQSKPAEGTIADSRIRLSVVADQPASPDGTSLGSATTTVEGGKPKYTFTWDNGESGPRAEGLSAGTHTVTVTDDRGCEAIGSVEITQEIAELVLELDRTAKSVCAGDGKNQLTASISGGLGPYNLQWSDPALTGEQVDGLHSGTYSVTVTDSRGISASQSVNIPAVPALALTAVANGSTQVGTDEGRAQVTATGGSGIYAYLWDNGESTRQAKLLSAGAHQVTVTDDQGCTATAEVTISTEYLELAVQLQQTKASHCAGESDNALEAIISGGLAPYRLAWSESSLSGQQPQNLAPGTYQVTVTDDRGATTSGNIVIPAPEPLTAEVVATASSTHGEAQGKATARASGGSGNYTYAWDHGQTGRQASNLSPGLHEVTITDEKGCQLISTVEISTEYLALTVNLEQTSASNCAGENTNALEASITGGLAPYQLAWSESDLAGQQVGNLAPGTYALTVTDDRGSTTSESIVIPALAPLTAETTATSSSTHGRSEGKATARASGGSGTYTYAWDHGQSGRQATNLSPGTHEVTITDDKGCQFVTSVEIGTEYLELAVALQLTGQSKCAGDGLNQIEASISGGAEPYQSTWESGGTGVSLSGVAGGVQRITVTDAQGKTTTASINVPKLSELTVEASVDSDASTNETDGRASVSARGGTGPYSYRWDNGESERRATNLAPGVHGVTVTDANGCTAQSSVTISENISALSVAAEAVNALKCHGDQTAAVELVVRGGKGPFTYQWNDDGLSGASLQGVGAGTFAVTVTDVVGNTSSASVTIEEPAPLEAAVVEIRGVTDEASQDGRAQVQVQGGTGTVRYTWDNDYTGDKVTNLAIGTHHVTVSDANGCAQVLSFEVDKKILPQLSLSKLRDGQVVQMQMLRFDADSTNLRDDAKPILDEVYEFLKDNPAVVIRVEGHTNNIPSDEFCDRLSTARAKSVATYIVQQGIADERVYYSGYGKRKPLYSNRTPEGRRKNQRVEIKILKVREDG